MWKHRLYWKLCVPHKLTVTVCHYPPGASKWNPIEHRLFSEISKNWAGQPLVSYETVVNFIRTTGTDSSLTVEARLVPTLYPKGEAVSDAEMADIPVVKHAQLPDWNYELPSPEM